MATNDVKMVLIPTGTWPTPQNVRRPYLKLRLGTCVNAPPLRRAISKNDLLYMIMVQKRATTQLTCSSTSSAVGFSLALAYRLKAKPGTDHPLTPRATYDVITYDVSMYQSLLTTTSTLGYLCFLFCFFGGVRREAVFTISI